MNTHMDHVDDPGSTSPGIEETHVQPQASMTQNQNRTSCALGIGGEHICHPNAQSSGGPNVTESSDFQGSWGDELSPVIGDTIRIIFQNVNGITPSSMVDAEIQQNMKRLQGHIFGMSEICQLEEYKVSGLMGAEIETRVNKFVFFSFFL